MNHNVKVASATGVLNHYIPRSVRARLQPSELRAMVRETRRASLETAVETWAKHPRAELYRALADALAPSTDTEPLTCPDADEAAVRVASL